MEKHFLSFQKKQKGFVSAADKKWKRMRTNRTNAHTHTFSPNSTHSKRASKSTYVQIFSEWFAFVESLQTHWISTLRHPFPAQEGCCWFFLHWTLEIRGSSTSSVFMSRHIARKTTDFSLLLPSPDAQAWVWHVDYSDDDDDYGWWRRTGNEFDWLCIKVCSSFRSFSRSPGLENETRYDDDASCWREVVER